MIIWIASYPKSGNTWVRFFLNSLLFSKNKKININDIKIKLFPIRRDFENLTKNIDNLEEFVKNCLFAQARINLDNKIKILKTHNAFWRAENFSFTNKENTLATIYIVRDPRNVITSIKNHYNIESYEKSLEFMTNEKKIISIKKNPNLEIDLPTVISSWKNHYNSWKKLNAKYLLIKYENLINEPLKEFTKIVKFLEQISNFKFKLKDILESIDNCDFVNMKKQENDNGFVEAPTNNLGEPIKFFNLGPDNNWKNMLSPEIVKNIENKFGSEMKEIGYL